MTTGTLTIAVYDQDQFVNHAYERQDFINANDVQVGKFFQGSIVLAQGVDYVFNGTVDVPANNSLPNQKKWWCGGAGQKMVLIAAWWNNQPLALSWQSNGGSGCNFKIHTPTSPIVCPANDQDCDGYTANNSNQALKDCNDLNQMQHPNQLEAWGDTGSFADSDCDTHNDPPLWTYSVTGASASMHSFELVDPTSWQPGNVYTRKYPMTWNSATSSYRVSVGTWVAPKEYAVRYKDTAYPNPQNPDPEQNWLWTPPYLGDTSCPTPFTHQVTESYFNTLVTGFQKVYAKNCHWFKQ